MATDSETDFVTVAEAANLLAVSTVTVARWLKQGRLCGYRVGPRRIRIRRSDLAKLYTLLHGDKSNTLVEDQRSPVESRLRPLGAEEIERRLEAIRDAHALREAILERRGGKLLPSSWKVISKARQTRHPGP